MVALPIRRQWAESRETALAIAAIGLATALLRLPYLWWPITMDEAGYAVGAHWWARGITLYSDDLWFDRPQGIFVAYGLGATIVGESVAAVRTWGAIWFWGGSVALWMLARQLLDGRRALIAALIATVALATPLIEGFTANAEAFMVPATTLSAALVWQRRFGRAGLVAGIAVLLKPSGAAAVGLGLMWLAWTRGGPREWALFVGAAFAPIAAAAAHGWATIGIGPYLDAAILFRMRHPAEFQFERMLESFVRVSGVIAPLLIWGGVGASRMDGRARTFWAMWSITALGGVAMGGNWWLHYYLQLVPPLALGYAAMFARTPDGPSIAPWVRVMGLAAIVATMLARVVGGPAQAIDAIYGKATGILVAEDVGHYLRDHTDPSDRVYVAFTAPAINYFSERMSSDPRLYAHPLEYVPGAYQHVLDSARAGTPRYVVVMGNRPAHEAQVEELQNAMQGRYLLDREFVAGSDRATVYARLDLETTD